MLVCIAVPDVAVPDVAVPDVAVPDVEVPDVAVPKLEVQESVDVVQVEEEPLVTYDLGKEESLPQEVIEEMAVMVEVKDELHAAYSLESLDEPSEPDQQDAPVEQTEEVINDESAVSETVEAIVMTPQDIDITCDVHNGEAPVPIVEAAEAVVMEETPIELNCDETAGEVEVKKPSRKASPSMNKMDLVNIIAHAAERKKRESRESSVDSQGGLVSLLEGLGGRDGLADQMLELFISYVSSNERFCISYIRTALILRL